MTRPLLTLSLLLPLFLSAQVDGYWMGVLRATPNDSLRVGLNVWHQDSNWIASLDSPDQYSSDLKVNKLVVKNDTVVFTATALAIAFKGSYDSLTDVVSGSFRQGRGSFPITFRRIQERVIAKRPQTPQAPFPYEEEEYKLTYKHETLGDIKISGTITYPSDNQKNNNKLLILISGSGWQDRDETILGHKPFAVIADYLTREGYSVFRYDDLPRGQFVKCTTEDFAKVAQYLVDYFTLFCERTKNVQIGLMGHSEGGTIAMMVASRSKNVDFVVSLAGMMVPVKQTLLYQIDELGRADNNFTEEEVRQSLKISEELYNTIAKAKDTKDAMTKSTNLLKSYSENMTDAQKKKFKLTQTDIFSSVQNVSSPWFFYLLKMDPNKYIRKVKCPILALNGEKDMQVEAKANFDVLMKNLPKSTSCETKSYSNLNHLFQLCTTGLPNEYGKIEQTIDPQVLQDIVTWLNQL